MSMRDDFLADMEHLDLALAHDNDEDCPQCGAHMSIRRELYGEDADGNRGELRTYIECPRCEWEPGQNIEICDVCGEWDPDAAMVGTDLLCSTCREEAEQDFAAQVEVDAEKDAEEKARLQEVMTCLDRVMSMVGVTK